MSCIPETPMQVEKVTEEDALYNVTHSGKRV